MMHADTFRLSSMAGKVAVITGSTQGLGEAIAHLFADRGAAGIVICGRNADKGDRVRADIEKKGAKAIFVPGSLENIEDCRKLIAEADKTFGRIDTLVNSAAITDRGTIWDTSPELFDLIFSVNVRAPFFLTQEAAKVMRRENTAGAIVNIISMSGHGGQSFITAYCASKGALITLTRNVAFSLMRHRIRVNGLTIGWMDTPAEDRIMKTYHAAEDGLARERRGGTPLGAPAQAR